jgi:hypothetical protein
MLRLRIQAPEHATLRLASVSLLTTEPMQLSQQSIIDLPDEATGTGVDRFVDRAQNMAMPLFHLPDGIDAEAMLSLRDQLRTRWPAALIVPAGVTPQAIASGLAHSIWWAACVVYLLTLVWLAFRPFKGNSRAWLEIAGCLLGPLWLIAGVHWGLYPTPLGFTAFGAGLLFALRYRTPASASAVAMAIVTARLAMAFRAFRPHRAADHSLRSHAVATAAWSRRSPISAGHGCSNG